MHAVWQSLLPNLWWIALLLVANIVAFILMGADKARAQKKAWRISERTLLIASACFGSLGGMAGMLAFRHKTQHAKFVVGIPAMFVAQLALIAWWLAR